MSKNEDIVIQKTDKGNAIVVLDRKDYDNGLMAILNDTSKFMIVNIPRNKDILNLILSQESKLVDFLKSIRTSNKTRLNIEGGIDNSTYFKLYPTGTTPGRLYGNAKVHKPLTNGKPKFRPIISSIGTISHQVAKYLLPILKPLETNEYVTKDSFDFAYNIRSIKADTFMASMDIESLFTNLPLTETIELCCNKLFHDNTLVSGLNRKEFKKLMEIATQENVFMFNGKFYKQINGVAMGSPLGPILSNIFLCHHEKLWLEECPSSFKPRMYTRYVDDIFLLFSDLQHLDLFKNFMNTRHTNIKFTSEVEKDNQLAFLDVNITKHNRAFKTG